MRQFYYYEPEEQEPGLGFELVVLGVIIGLWWLAVAFPGSAALVNGWLRIKSGSILSAWMLHASANFTVALTVMTFV